MQTLSLADHFATPLMSASTFIFLALEVVSLIIFVIVVLQYKRIVLKHQLLPRAIQHTLEEEPKKGVNALLRLYIIMTVITTIVTIALFWFQPSLF